VALDWPAVLERLAAQCRTLRAARLARDLPLTDDLETLHAGYARVDELLTLEREGEEPPTGAVHDILGELGRAARGVTLEVPELVAASRTLRALLDLRRWLERHRERLPQVALWTQVIDVAPDLLGNLESSFTPDGEISTERYPELRRLRQALKQQRERVRGGFEDLLRSDAWAEVLQDRYVTEREGRFVLPVKSSRRTGLGIVHDVSQSGETAYVEPLSLVDAQNDLRETAVAIRREERRILQDLSLRMGRDEPSLRAALDVAWELDLTAARARLGRELDAVVPHVGRDAVLRLRGARHPLLVLRGENVVPNDLHVDATRPGLVLTGPNAGGKTVTLKTVGLLALFVRATLPVPADPGSRIDLFEPILADIGDLQAVEEGISTFSGHLLFLGRALRAAGPHALVLLDELAVGTEPRQGAALARAVLEAMVERGARVVVTTHYGELEALSGQDPRFVTAGVSFEEGRPTFRFREGYFGRSHALAVARRLGLPASLLVRAEALLDEGDRHLAALGARLEAELDAARRAREEAEKRGLRRSELEALERRLEARERESHDRLVQATRQRLAEEERSVKDLVAALQADPDLARAGRTLQEIRKLRDALVEPSPPPATPAPRVHAGDLLMLPRFGRKARVLELGGDGRVLLEIGGMRSWLRLDEIEAVRVDATPSRPQALPRPEETPPSERLSGLPHAENRLDLRGQRVEEALEAVDAFLDRLVLRNEPVAFLLHGHGSGVLKKAVRAHLSRHPQVRRWRPAEEGEGGDAFTLADLS
jgi:DNA mismatch repair protein MutS2